MTDRYKHLNYFAKNEQVRMSDMAKFKTQFFSPLLKLLDRTWCSPNFISLCWFLCIIWSGFLISAHPLYAFILLVLHVIFDWLDWSLARYQKLDSNAWAFVDIVVDQSGLIILCLALIYHWITNSFWTSLYLTTYILMIVFLIYNNTLGKSISFVLRTKYIAFAWLLLLYIQPSIWSIFYEYLFIGWSIYQLIVVIYLFYSIKWSLE